MYTSYPYCETCSPVEDVGDSILDDWEQLSWAGHCISPSWRLITESGKKAWCYLRSLAALKHDLDFATTQYIWVHKNVLFASLWSHESIKEKWVFWSWYKFVSVIWEHMFKTKLSVLILILIIFYMRLWLSPYNVHWALTRSRPLSGSAGEVKGLAGVVCQKLIDVLGAEASLLTN